MFAFDHGGAAEAGVASLILLVPSAIAAPFAAYAGDRFRRDRVLLVTYLLQALTLGVTALALFADTSVALVYGAATFASITITFTRPAQNSLVPALTERPEDLTAANVATGIVEGVGKMLGPVVAGILLGVSEPRSVFATFAVVTLVEGCSSRGCGVDTTAVTPAARIGASPVRHRDPGRFTHLAPDREPRLIVILLSSGVVVWAPSTSCSWRRRSTSWTSVRAAPAT